MLWTCRVSLLSLVKFCWLKLLTYNGLGMMAVSKLENEKNTSMMCPCNHTTIKIDSLNVQNKMIDFNVVSVCCVVLICDLAGVYS